MRELENSCCVKVPVEAVPNVLSITGNFHLAVSGRDLDLKKRMERWAMTFAEGMASTEEILNWQSLHRSEKEIMEFRYNKSL